MNTTPPTAPLLTVREILLARLETYRQEVAAGRHTPPTSARTR